MKTERVKTLETTEEVSSPPGEKEHWSQKNIATPPVPKEKQGGQEKRLAVAVGKEENRKKGPTMVMGMKSNGKSRIIS